VALLADGGWDGFLHTRASLMLDVVFTAMFLVIPVLGWSVWLVKYRGAYELHKRIQLALVGVLAVTVFLFELDMRVHGWRERAEPSPYYGDGAWSLVCWSLYIHLAFAVSTAVLWTLVTARALRNFEDPPRPNSHSVWHRRWGQLAAIDMLLTAVTGWIFYWLAFAAR
jgi:uncharacterized membrane protein YozB (DUF420 family)